MSEEVVEESDSHPRCPECPSHESGIEIPDVDDVWIGCDECNVSVMSIYKYNNN